MENITAINQESLHQLRLRWLLTAAVSFLLLLAAGLLFSSQFYRTLGLRWTLGSGIVWGYVLRTLWRFLEVNVHPQQQVLRSQLGAGTLVTLFRGFLLALLGGYILVPPSSGIFRWIPAFLYLLAALSDGVDGYLARKNDHVTVLGAQIDMRLDALGILLAIALGIHYGQLDVWYLIVGMAYYLFAFGKYVRQFFDLPVLPLQSRRHRSVLAGLQMGFLAVVLWPVFTPPATTLAAYLFGTPLLITFLRDYFIVAGWLKPDQQFYKQVSAKFIKISCQFLLPGIRIGIVGISFAALMFFPHLMHTFSESVKQSVLFELLSSAAIIGITGISLAGIFFGVLPRISGLLFTALLASYLTIAGMHPLMVPEMVLALLLVIFGSGRLSLFPWEDTVLYGRSTINTRTGEVNS